mgnify:CR=1 FL=1
MGRANHLPTEMSGGQQQRVGIARAFVSSPKVIFADEPTGNLDSRTSKQVLYRMLELSKNNHVTFVMVTHEPELAECADRIVTILDGKVCSNVLQDEETKRKTAMPCLPIWKGIWILAERRRRNSPQKSLPPRGKVPAGRMRGSVPAATPQKRNNGRLAPHQSPSVTASPSGEAFWGTPMLKNLEVPHLKRLFTLLTALMLATALCAPVLAEDAAVTDPAPDPTPTPTASIDTSNSDGVYVSAYTVTNAAGGEVTTVEVGDRINLVLKVVDHASARYCVKPEEISARINSAVFTYTGTGEIGQLFDNNDDPNATRLQNVRNGSATADEIAQNAQYNYYSYVLLFRDVIYNGGGNTVPINLSYLDTSKPLQQFSVTIGQCVDKDQTTSPNLLVRTSSYGDSVIAGSPFTLSLGLYATDGNENLNDVIVSLTCRRISSWRLVRLQSWM